MGTRSDFYVKRGEDAEWIGSFAWDGYPGGFDASLYGVTTEQAFREWVATEAAKRDDFTHPDQGWPWPWETSHTTDFAYAFDEGRVWVADFGKGWVAWRPEFMLEDDSFENQPRVVFPDMSDRKAVTYGKRSGTITIVNTPDGMVVDDLP